MLRWPSSLTSYFRSRASSAFLLSTLAGRRYSTALTYFEYTKPQWHSNRVCKACSAHGLIAVWGPDEPRVWKRGSFGIHAHGPAPLLLLQYRNFCRSMQTYASTKQYLCLVHTWTFYFITNLKTLHFIVVLSLNSETFEALLFAEISAEINCAPEKYLQFVSCGRVYAGVWWLFVNVWGHKLRDFLAFRLFCPKKNSRIMKTCSHCGFMLRNVGCRLTDNVGVFCRRLSMLNVLGVARRLRLLR